MPLILLFLSSLLFQSHHMCRSCWWKQYLLFALNMLTHWILIALFIPFGFQIITILVMMVLVSLSNRINTRHSKARLYAISIKSKTILGSYAFLVASVICGFWFYFIGFVVIWPEISYAFGRFKAYFLWVIVADKFDWQQQKKREFYPFFLFLLLFLEPHNILYSKLPIWFNSDIALSSRIFVICIKSTLQIFKTQ